MQQLCRDGRPCRSSEHLRGYGPPNLIRDRRPLAVVTITPNISSIHNAPTSQTRQTDRHPQESRHALLCSYCSSDGGLMHLVQLMDWRGAQPQHVHHICTKCNGSSIEARCTSRNIATVWYSECVHNYRPLWWSRYRPRESVCCTCLCVCVCELTVDLQLARWSMLTLLGHTLTSCHRSSSRSQEKNVSIVVGATSSEGFYSYSFWFGAWQWRFFCYITL